MLLCYPQVRYTEPSSFVIGNPSELLAEHIPYHPRHDDISRIEEQEFIEFADTGQETRASASGKWQMIDRPV